MIDYEEKHLLEENLALSKDNHRMLRAIRRDQWLSFIGKLIFWAIVLALPFYFYQQYLQPLVGQFSAMTGTATSGPFGMPTSADVQKLLESFKAGQ